MKINLQGAPPTKMELWAARNSPSALGPTEGDIGYMGSMGTAALLMLPPLVLADSGYGSVYEFSSDTPKELEPVFGAIRRDWSQNAVNAKYVEAVRSQNRDLIRAEVDALEQNLRRSNTDSK